MAYRKTEYHFKDSIEVEEHLDGRYGAKGRKRVKKKKPTLEQMRENNRRTKAKMIRRKIKNNFQEGDYYLTFTFKKENRPPTMEDAKEIWGKVQRKIRDEYKKRKERFKWIIVIERGARGGIHFHIVMNRIENGDKILRKCWPYGGIHMQFLYAEGGYKDLADYLAKEPPPGTESHYSSAKNLPIPEPKKKKLKHFPEEPKAYKGYYIDKSSVFEGINPVTGFPYRYYEMIKVKRRI